MKVIAVASGTPDASFWTKVEAVLADTACAGPSSLDELRPVHLARWVRRAGHVRTR